MNEKNIMRIDNSTKIDIDNFNSIMPNTSIGKKSPLGDFFRDITRFLDM